MCALVAEQANNDDEEDWPGAQKTNPDEERVKEVCDDGTSRGGPQLRRHLRGLFLADNSLGMEGGCTAKMRWWRASIVPLFDADDMGKTVPASVVA